MTSSYSTDLKLELMVTGENAGTWGDKTNTNLNLVQQAIAGYEAIALSDGGTVALAMSNAALSNARNMVLKFTGTLTTASTVTIPDSIEKFYIIDLSAVTGVTNLTIKTVSGTGFTAGEAAIVAAYSDGTNLNEIALNTLGGTIGSAQIDANSITAAKISNNAVTTDKILASNVTTAKLAASAVTANNITQSTITQSKLAADSVGPNQLIATGVSAAEYTSATVTVDADGRITAASSGSAGAGGNVLRFVQSNSGSGTYTTPANANYLTIYAGGAAGGGGGAGVTNNRGGAGGPGPFGLFEGPVAGSTGLPYAIGSGGNGGNAGEYGGVGNAGGNTSLTNFFTISSGGGGNGGGPGFNGNTGSTGSINVGTRNLNLDSYRSQAGMPANHGVGGAGGQNPLSSGRGFSGGSGAIAIFTNDAT